MHRHAVHQPGPQALVKLGLRVPIKTSFDGRRTSSGATELSAPATEANGCAACEDAEQLHNRDARSGELQTVDGEVVDEEKH